MRAFDGGSGSRKKARKHLPTPTVSGNYNRVGCSEKSGDGLFTALSEVFGSVTGKPSLRRFVEWTMGFPQDWTAIKTQKPSAPSEIPCFHRSPNSSVAPSLRRKKG